MTDSIDSDTNEVELVGVDEDTMTAEIDFGAGVTVHLTPVEDGFELFMESHGETYKETVKRDFYGSQQKRGRIGNSAASQIGQDPGWLKSRLRDLGVLLQKVEEELETGLVVEDAQDLMDRTQRVLGFDEGEGATFRVQISPPEESPVETPRWITFESAGEWLNFGQVSLNRMHYGQFFEPCSVAEEDVDIIRGYWSDELEHVPGGESKESRVAQTVLEALQRRLPGRIYTSSERLVQDAMNALYESEGEHDVDHGGDIVWVQTNGIEQLIDSNTSESGTGNASKVVRPLRQRGIVVGDSMRRRAGDASTRRTVWPVDADELGIEPEIDVVRGDESPEDEIP